MRDTSDDSDWTTWSKYIINEIERFDRDIQKLFDHNNEMTKSINELQIKVEGMNAKIGIWGGLVGAIIGIGLSLAITLLLRII